MKIRTAFLCVVVGLTGCRDLMDGSKGGLGQADSLSGAIEQLEAEGKIPKLDRSNDREGPDSDQNGIRDDIDSYIESLDVRPKEKEAVTAIAAGHQRIQSAEEMNNAVAKEIAQEYAPYIFCVGVSPNADGEKFDQISRNIEVFTANTEQRARRYTEYNWAMDGSNINLPSFQECDNMGY